ncbi:MAG TPA: hypothetical protein VF323_09205 [Candidatus Limnocylindrales bacterium]
MIASDLGFLALGGILGIVAGAALIAILRTRHPTPRQIRLTVTPGSVPIRPWATTLAGDPFAPEPRRVARGGPADIDRQHSDIIIPTVGAPRGRKGTAVRSALPHDSSPVAPETPTVTNEAADPGTVADARPDDPADRSVGLTIDSGHDPVLAAIAASGVTRGDAAAPEDGAAEGGVGVPLLVGRPGHPVALHETEAGSGVAILEAAMRARRGSAGTAVTAVMASIAATAEVAGTADEAGVDEVAGNITVATAPEPVQAPARPRATARPGGRRSTDRPGTRDDPARAARPAADPCADARNTVDERCALAERMRISADEATDALREAQRTFDDHVAQADAAEAIAEPRAQRAAKDEAQNTFRMERGRAGSREAVEQAARDWLQEINRVNAAARDAASTLTREREAAAAIQAMIERLTVEADAARVQAEGAAESCVLARESLATCEDEAREAEIAAKARPDRRRPQEPDPAPTEETPIAVPVAATWAGQTAPGPAEAQAPVEDDGALVAAVRSGGHPALLRLLAGDRAVMQRLVLELAGEDTVVQRRWQIQLADLIDAIVSRAIEACAFVLPEDHPFWAPFNRTQGRDIALALSSLGFRFDGMGGFSDDRVPTQRDVSLALSYAGLDPMRVRRWPAETELTELYRDVTVAADEYILGAAPDLTLGELVGILGRRADPLTEVWNAWAQIRPILLEEIDA